MMPRVTAAATGPEDVPLATTRRLIHAALPHLFLSRSLTYPSSQLSAVLLTDPAHDGAVAEKLPKPIVDTTIDSRNGHFALCRSGRRHLPTPCRAGCRPRSTPASTGGGSHCSLRAQPAAVPGVDRDASLHLGTTTIHALLLLHFKGRLVGSRVLRAGDSSCPGLAPPPAIESASVRISLASSVPLTAHQTLSLSLQDLLPDCSTRSLDWLDADIRHVFADSTLPKPLRQLFSRIEKWDHSSEVPPHEILIYTDGSAAQDARASSPCSWAFTVWFKVGVLVYFFGHASSTAVPAQTPFYAGEVDDTAVTAELLALFWALSWSAEFGPKYQAPLAYYYDAISVGTGAFGESREVKYPLPPQGPSLPASVSYLRQLVTARCRAHHFHVKGHSGHFANELTDRLAGLARMHEEGYYQRCLPTWPHRLINHKLRDWAWLASSPQCDLPTVYAFESEARRLQHRPELPTHAPHAGEVLVGFESLQLREDHRPVYLRAEYCQHVNSGAFRTVSRRAVRPPTVSTPEETREQAQRLALLSCVSWDTPIDDQYQHFVQQWTDTGRGMSSMPGRQPVQCFLSERTLDYIDKRKALRTYLGQEEAEQARRRVMIAFTALLLNRHGTIFSDRALRIAALWLAEVDVSIARAIALLRHFAKAARKQVAADRRAYLHSLTERVQLSDIKDSRALYQAVRKAFPAAKSARRSNLVPLPAVCDSDGHFAQTPTDRLELWRSHFASQELGEAVSSAEYLARFRSRPPRDSFVFDANVLPSLRDTEQVILGLHRHKAAGPDGITADLLRASPGAASRQLLPILLKSALMLQEPVEFRGGNLICLAKRAGAALRRQDFRSILLAAVPAKVQHRLLRGKLLPVLAAQGHPTQAGARPGVGLETVSLLARSFQAVHQQCRQMWSITFFDLQAAYYRVVREMLVPSHRSDYELRELLHKAGLPRHTLLELSEQLERIAALPQMGASPHLTAMVGDLLHATWFHMDLGDLLTCTERGTRPGDPAADVLFSLSFTAFLKTTEQALRERSLLAEPIGKDPRPQWAEASAAGTLGMPAWADDFTHLQNARDPAELLHRVGATTSVIQERATAVGMRLNYAPDKTAVLLPAGIDWRTHGRLVEMTTGTLCVQIRDDLSQEVHALPVVAAYKHLGTILTCSGDPRPDLAHRASRAVGVTKSLGKRLFGNRQIPLTTRRLLLRSLAISRFVHSGAALLLPAAIHQRAWDQAYVRIWRALLPREAEHKTAHSYNVLRAAQAASPPLALARSRAGFLLRLTLHGPEVLRTFLFDHWTVHPAGSWLRQLEDDVRIVVMHLPEVGQLLDLSSPVLSLLEAYQTTPRWWPNQVKRAERAFLRDLDKWAARPAAVSHADTAAAAGPAPFKCPVCPSAFKLRKHLGVHLARSHAILSPSRHFAYDVYCISCHRWYGTVRQVQQHL
ncbi:unnamed protein product [Symbiodinium sp. CCMP2456]|nr:unnamed protein product [Symbiodinium sp. CCMP2456]